MDGSSTHDPKTADVEGSRTGDLITERLLRVIDEGRRTATYKLALLLALMDHVAAHPGADTVPTRAIAAHVLTRYFDQVRTFVTTEGTPHELRQISMKSSPVIRAADDLRRTADEHRCRTIPEIRTQLEHQYEAAVDVVEDTFVRYPIPLLQVVGTQLVPFLYRADWGEGASVRALRREDRDEVRLLPGVADRLVALGPLVRPLVELHWARDVARWTGIPTEDERLRAHLFGTDRTTFPRDLRDGLVELQRGSCFYCGQLLHRRIEIDHFLPWSRWPNDAIENLVAADRCNTIKSDHLAAQPHLQRWANHAAQHASDLAELATESRWMSDPGRTRGLLTSTYGRLTPGTPLWLRGSEFTIASGAIALE